MSEKKPDASAAPAAAAAPEKGGGGIKAMLPAILAIVLAPAATFGVAQFVLLPRFEASLQTALADPAKAGDAHAAAPAAAAAHAAPAKAAGGHGAKPAKGGDAAASPNTYRFENVVVNLAGTMGTRYLKASFIVSGPGADIVTRFDAARPQLGDVTIAVLSSLTLADLEESGSKNIIRERLLAAYNQALGGKLVDNLFFSDFVVQ